MARGTLGKKVRFGVFKRDSFACRYCGATAPNVQLHVDHVVPVSDGGSDDPDNLVTACAACNVGKGSRNLDGDDLSALKENGPADPIETSLGERPGDGDDPVDPSLPDDDMRDGAGFASRHEQTRAIEDRRNQLEMVIEWREEVVSLLDEAVDALDRRIIARTGLSMNEECRQRMRRWVRHHGLAAIFEALEDALDQMLEWQDGVVMIASWERAFAAIPQILELRQIARDKPHFRELVYICGLLRRRLHYVNELRCLRLMEDGVEAGASIEAMKAFARTVKNWTAFRKGLEDFINDYGRPGDALDGALADAPPRHSGNAAAGGRAEPAKAAVKVDPRGAPDGPFDKRRPLRHFSGRESLDQTGGSDHEIAGTGARHRSG